MGRFRVKISTTWYSNEYIYLKYSTNGIFWKTIKCYKYDPLDGVYMGRLESHISNAESLITKFNTLEKVLSFQDKEKERVSQHRDKIFETKKRENTERLSVLKRFS